MGGEALRNFGAVPLTKRKYQLYLSEVITKTSKVFSSSKDILDIPFFFNKDTFGDIDLVCHSLDSEMEVAKLLQALDSTKITPSVVNGNVLSVLYKDAQIDFIRTTKEDQMCTLLFHMFNGSSGLLNKIFGQFGMELTESGLKMVIMDGTNKVGELVLSKNPGNILKSIGMDFDQYKYEMNAPQQLYDYIIKSPFYNVGLFQSSEAPSEVLPFRPYSSQLVLRHQEIAQVEPVRTFEGISKEEATSQILNFFGLANAYNALVNNYNRELQVKQKFNGTLVMEWLGGALQEGPALGSFIAYFQNTVRGGFSTWIMKSSEEKISLAVKEQYENFKTEEARKAAQIQRALGLVREQTQAREAADKQRQLDIEAAKKAAPEPVKEEVVTPAVEVIPADIVQQALASSRTRSSRQSPPVVEVIATTPTNSLPPNFEQIRQEAIRRHTQEDSITF